MSTNIQWQSFKLNKAFRAKLKHQHQHLLYLRMTGLLGVDKYMHTLGVENFRQGLNQDLNIINETPYTFMNEALKKKVEDEVDF